MRRGVELLREQNLFAFDGLVQIGLARAEARAGDVDRALTILDEALATCERTGHRSFEAELHRVCGEMLLKRDPANPTPAEEALQAAIAVAKQQGTRSFELRAALSLAKLYQSTGRPAEAHAVLAPALEGFSPTPEMPELSEAQALLAALAEMDEVKTGLAQRQRRLDLQTSYGQALMWGKGFGADETKAAFARVGELGEATDARFVAYDAQCLGKFMRGELRQAREMAENFLREAEADGRATEAGAARRMLGVVLLFQGELKAARSILERALVDYVPERDGETQLRFGRDTEVSAAAYLALAEWRLGEVERARLLIERSIRRAKELNRGAAIANGLFWKTVLECNRDDVLATQTSADALMGLTEDHGIKTYAEYGRVYAFWANGRLLDANVGAADLRQALAALTAQGQRSGVPLVYGLLAELETATHRPDVALTLVDQGLGIADETEERYTDPYLHRLRGDILLNRDPTDTARAEEAFKTAIAIAKEQSARTYELLASLALAKLYQSTGRPAEAHAVLAPALEGFCADARNAGDRGGAGAVGGYRGRRACEARINTTMSFRAILLTPRGCAMGETRKIAAILVADRRRLQPARRR